MEKGNVQRIIMDMDPGIDDALALILALKSPEVQVMGISTVAGNAPVALTSANACQVLEACNIHNIPVAKGAASPLERPLEHALSYHGPDGLGKLALPERKFPLDPEPAPELISQLASQHPHEIVLVATGPLTNIAQAFQSHPQLPKLLSRMILMGGAYHITPFGRGNKTPLAEFNIWQDPEAAFIVFTSGIDVTAIGLDVSANPEVCLSNKHLNQLETGHSPAISLAIQLTEYAIQHHGCCELHDPLTLASLLDPSLFSFMSVPVEVITTSDEERGMTRILPLGLGNRMPFIHLAIDVDEARFIQLFLSRVFGR